MAVKGDTINDLPRVAGASELVGALVEFEVLSGPGGARVNKGGTIEQLAEATKFGVSANNVPSLLKEFRFFRAVDRDADSSGGACFETDIDYATCCALTVARIEFYRENDGEDFRQQDLECVYDSSPTPAGLAYVDGNFSGSRNPSKFVKVVAGASAPTNGRNRGPHAPSTAYLKYDLVTQAGLSYYAKADFTSGATFDATKWTIFAGDPALVPAKATATNQFATLADIGQISFVDVPLAAVSGSYPIPADCAGKRFIINDGTASTFISLRALANDSLGKVFAITISNGVRQQLKPVAFGSFIGGDYIELGETALLLVGKQAAGPSFYYNGFKIGPLPSTGLPAGGAYRDPYAVGDKAAVVAAVTDASNTWVNGDLTAYGTSALQDAGAPPVDPAGQAASILVGSADVAHPDTFDKEDVNGGAGWRYVYGRRNDGTSGWTRIPKG